MRAPPGPRAARDSQSTPPQGNVSVTGASVRWGSQSAPLQTAADGLRLLPAGRNRDLPWFNINQIVLTLSRPANVSPGDVTVMGITGGIYGPVTISGSGTSTIVITLAKGITSAERVTVTIANSQIASYTRRLDILPGDVNDDGMVNRTDGDLILKHETPAHAYRASFDLNGDHTVNSGDIKLDRARVGTKLPALADSGRNPRSKNGSSLPRARSRRASAIAGAFEKRNSGTTPGLDLFAAWVLRPTSASAEPSDHPVTAALADEVFSAAEHDLLLRPLSTLAALIDADSKTVVKRATAPQQSRPHRVPLLTGE